MCKPPAVAPASAASSASAAPAATSAPSSVPRLSGFADHEFFREYFLQTRKEIDTEKNSRDNILNFIILSMGAISFSVFQSNEPMRYLQSKLSIFIELSMILIITALFWLRKQKLVQIKDRWKVLHNLVNMVGPSVYTLEESVHEKLTKKEYFFKDAVICFALSSPIYCLLGYCLYSKFDGLMVALVGTDAVLLAQLCFINKFIINSDNLRKPFTRGDRDEATT